MKHIDASSQIARLLEMELADIKYAREHKDRT